MSSKTIWKFFLAWSIVLLLLLAFSYPAIEPGSGAHVVSVLSLVFIAATILGVVIMMHVDWDPFEHF